MKLPDSLLAIVFLAAALTMAAPAAFPEPPKSRAEALAALKNADTATRAEAVVWIANRGSMADAPLLHERLRDESAFVRGFAEQGLWLLWTRFEGRRVYTEREVNEILKAANAFGDHVTLRRELVNHQLLTRKSDCSEYRKVSALPDEEVRALLVAWRARSATR